MMRGYGNFGKRLRLQWARNNVVCMREMKRLLCLQNDNVGWVKFMRVANEPPRSFCRDPLGLFTSLTQRYTATIWKCSEKEEEEGLAILKESVGLRQSQEADVVKWIHVVNKWRFKTRRRWTRRALCPITSCLEWVLGATVWNYGTAAGEEWNADHAVA